MSSQFRIVGLSKIREYWGESERCFSVELHCEVSMSGSPGGEAFRVVVMSPAELEKELSAGNEATELGRGYLFLLDYDEEVVKTSLEKLIDRAGARNWDELYSAISRYFDWI